MGRGSLSRPERLAEKLLSIRKELDFSQNEMIGFLELKDNLTQAEISAFERGVRIPPLLVLLRYARKYKTSVETLIDDKLNLPYKGSN